MLASVTPLTMKAPFVVVVGSTKSFVLDNILVATLVDFLVAPFVAVAMALRDAVVDVLRLVFLPV